MAEISSIDLCTLQIRVRDCISENFKDLLWVRAEVQSVSEKRRHVYLNLVQTQPDGTTLASSRAMVWSSDVPAIFGKFQRVTGQQLAQGMKILALVEVRFHEVFGYSLNIRDIDPSYTLGEQEALRRQTIEALRINGLLERQKSLTLARLPYRLAVISSDTAAGYGDFCRHLEENSWGYKFHVDLFPALMQGDQAPASISAAIAAASSVFPGASPLPGLAASSTGRPAYDAILIIRGGGSGQDLIAYDDYNLAKAIALCPVPVFTAVGHDRDFHVCDMVSYVYVKTPTALADYFIAIYAEEDKKISAIAGRIAGAAAERLGEGDLRLEGLGRQIMERVRSRFAGLAEGLDYLEKNINGAFRRKVAEQTVRLDTLEKRILKAPVAKLDAEERMLEEVRRRIGRAFDSRVASGLRAFEGLAGRISYASAMKVAASGSRLEGLVPRLRSSMALRLTDAERAVELLEVKIKSSDPRNILAKGYALVLDGNERKIDSVTRLSPGDRMSVMFSDGTVRAEVTGVERRERDQGGGK